MKYSISSHSRVSFIKYSLPLALLVGALALSPWKQGRAQTGSEEGSTGSAGTMEPGSGSRRGATDSNDSYRTGGGSRGNTSPPSTTGGDSDTRQEKHKGMGPKGKNGSDGSGSRNGSPGMGSGSSGNGGSRRSPQ
jgi:hypothetical protein